MNRIDKPATIVAFPTLLVWILSNAAQGCKKWCFSGSYSGSVKKIGRQANRLRHPAGYHQRYACGFYLLWHPWI